MAAAATGTPSWALASKAYGAGWRSGTAARWASTAPRPSPTPSTTIEGWWTSSTELEAGAEPDEEDRSEEALGHREELLGHPAGLADRGDGQARHETGEHQGDVQRDRQGRHREDRGQADPQLDRELPVLRDAVHPSAYAAALDGAQSEEEDPSGQQHDHGSERRAGDVVRVDHQRQQDDAGGVGDRDLGQELHDVMPAEAQRVDDREHQGGRRRRHQDGVQRGMGDADEPRRGVPQHAGRDADGRRPRQSGAQRRAQARVADGHPCARDEHHQHEAGVAEEGERRVARVQHPEAGDARARCPPGARPRTTGRCQPFGVASRGPASATAQTIARSRNDTTGC